LGATYRYRVDVVDSESRRILFETDPVSLPKHALAVLSNYPNPIASRTTISFSIADPGRARMRIYDAAGRLVATLVDGPAVRGLQSVTWDGRTAAGERLAAGCYLIRLESGGRLAARKVTLSK
jgi:hypothetical protein